MNLDRNTTAVLALHWINDIVSEGGAFGGRFAGEVARTGTAGHARRVLTAARQTGVPVFYTGSSTSPDTRAHRECTAVRRHPASRGVPRRRRRRRDPAGTGPRGGRHGARHRPGLRVHRHRPARSTPGARHRDRRPDRVSTHITVQSSALAAVDLGYRVVIASDATSADSAATHEHALRALAVLCDVATSSEIVDALLDSPAGTAHEVRTP